MFTRRSKLPTLLVVSLALAAVLTSVAFAADNTPVKGSWKVTMEVQGQPVDVTLEIKEAEGGALSGTWAGPRGTDTLSDVKWDGTELSFSRKANRQGQEFTIKHTAKVTGDTMDGKMVMPQRELPFTGKRAS